MSQSSASALLRANQAFYQLLMDTQTLDYGIAFSNPTWAALPQAAQFREVLIPDPTQLSNAFESAEDYFHQQGLLCMRWAPAVDQPVGTLGEFLKARGFLARDLTVMRLAAWTEDSAGPPDLRVLPARPMRQAFAQTYLIECQDESAKTRSTAALEYLDEASMSLFVALQGDQPVGRAGLFEVGDLGLIVELYVSPAARRRGIGHALTTQLVQIARRSALRMVCAEVQTDNPAGLACLQSCGFVPDGQVCEFDRSTP